MQRCCGGDYKDETWATSNGNSSEESDTASWMPMSVIKITTQLYLTIYELFGV